MNYNDLIIYLGGKINPNSVGLIHSRKPMGLRGHLVLNVLLE